MNVYKVNLFDHGANDFVEVIINVARIDWVLPESKVLRINGYYCHTDDEGIKAIVETMESGVEE